MRENDDRRAMAGDTGVPRQVPRAAKLFWHALVLGGGYQGGKYSLLVLLGFGLAGVLIDLDHYVKDAMQMARPLHLQVFVSVWVCVFVVYAYYHRWFHNTCLKER